MLQGNTIPSSAAKILWLKHPRLEHPAEAAVRLAWTCDLYSTTSGYVVSLQRLETTVAQPFGEIVATARTTSRRFQHPAMDVIGLLRSFKAFGEASRSLAGPPEREQEKDYRERDGAVVQRRPYLWARGDHGEEPADYRRPRFQSSNRA